MQLRRVHACLYARVHILEFPPLRSWSRWDYHPPAHAMGRSPVTSPPHEEGPSPDSESDSVVARLKFLTVAGPDQGPAPLLHSGPDAKAGPGTFSTRGPMTSRRTYSNPGG